MIAPSIAWIGEPTGFESISKEIQDPGLPMWSSSALSLISTKVPNCLIEISFMPDVLKNKTPKKQKGLPVFSPWLLNVFTDFFTLLSTVFDFTSLDLQFVLENVFLLLPKNQNLQTTREKQKKRLFQ